jgi:SAM-dependent methyltransferase
MWSAGEQFLREFHARRPGVTREAFARGRAVGDGRSSYQLLADRVPASLARPVVDLGCGDGWLAHCLVQRGIPEDRLIGADISRAELDLARARLPGATWLLARAEALPLADASAGACVSHLAWSLLPDPDAAARELARILAPGGSFAIATGGGPSGDDAFTWLLDLLGPALADQRRSPRLGDKRTRSATGLDQLLGPLGFAPVRWTSHVVDLGGPWPDVWPTLSTIYELAYVDDEVLRRLHDALAHRAGDLERVPCTMAIGIASTTLQSARC